MPHEGVCEYGSVAPDDSDITLPEADRRELIRWAIACAERLLSRSPAEVRDDPRLREGLDGARKFADGRLSVGSARKHAFGCHAAAREASSPTARAVARACGQAVAVAHMAAHSRAIERYTRKALLGDEQAEELAWQRTHLPPRFRQFVYGGSS